MLWSRQSLSPESPALPWYQPQPRSATWESTGRRAGRLGLMSGLQLLDRWRRHNVEEVWHFLSAKSHKNSMKIPATWEGLAGYFMLFQEEVKALQTLQVGSPEVAPFHGHTMARTNYDRTRLKSEVPIWDATRHHWSLQCATLRPGGNIFRCQTMKFNSFLLKIANVWLI
jgi:hypothetical protein